MKMTRKESRRRTSSAVITLLFFASMSCAATPSAEDTVAVPIIETGRVDRMVDAQIRDLMTVGEIPSLAAAIIVDGETVWVKGYGEQPSLDTVFTVGSIAKTFIATSVFQLVEQGKLSLDDDVSDYLPFTLRNPMSPEVPITIRMLLAHRSGMAHDHPRAHPIDNDRRMHLWRFWAQSNVGSLLSIFVRRTDMASFLEEALTPEGRFYREDFWIARPGVRYQYSNTGLQQILPLVVENVTGQSYPEYVRKNIFDPLQMDDSGYVGSDFEDQLARPYTMVRGKMRELPPYGWKKSGSLRTTATDLSRFMIAHANGGRAGEVRLLEPESVEQMHTLVSPINWPSWFGLRYMGYGMGWSVYPDGFVGHSGGCPGYLSTMAVRSGDEGAIGAVLLVNRGASIDTIEWTEGVYAPIFLTLLDEAERQLGARVASAQNAKRDAE